MSYSSIKNRFTIPLHDGLLRLIRRYKNTEAAPLLLAAPFLLYVFFLFIIPIAYLLVVSFYTNVAAGTMESTYTFENYVKVFTSSLYLKVIYNTVEISLISTVFTILASFPIAYYIVLSNFRYSKVLILLVISPMLVGNVVRAFGWWTLMGGSGVFNEVFAIFGFEYTLMKTKPGLIIAISSVLMPFVVLILLSVLYTLDPDLISAGYNLGGNHLQTFFYVTLPHLIPGLLASTILSFVLTMGTFATAVFIGMPEVPMIGPFIYQTANNINWPLASALSFVLLTISLVLVYLYTRVASTEKPTGRESSADDFGRSRNFHFATMLRKLDFGHDIKGFSLSSILMGSLVFVCFFYLLIPVVFAVVISFNPSTVYAFPPESLTLKWYEYVLSRPAWVSSFITSFEYAGIASVIAIAISAPTAFALDRFTFPGKQALQAGTFLPLMIPQIILGLALLIYLNPFGLVGNILGLSIGVAVIAIPFSVQTMLVTLHNFDRKVEEAALNLGADEIQTFLRITLPGILPGVLTAAILTFIVSYANLNVAIFLQGVGTIPIPVRIFAQMQYGASPSIAAVATINIIIVLIAVVFVERLFGAAEALGFTSN